MGKLQGKQDATAIAGSALHLCEQAPFTHSIPVTTLFPLFYLVSMTIIIMYYMLHYGEMLSESPRSTLVYLLRGWVWRIRFRAVFRHWPKYIPYILPSALIIGFGRIHVSLQILSPDQSRYRFATKLVSRSHWVPDAISQACEATSSSFLSSSPPPSGPLVFSFPDSTTSLLSPL